jgi:hypothetical protein
MKGLRQRVARIEPALQPKTGCETCRGWTWVVLEGEDGPHRPERCPDCGRQVPSTVVVQLVGLSIALI